MNNNLHFMIKNFIRREYVIRADILTNICNHVDDLNQDSIIYHTNRNKLMNRLSTCILTLNTNYNESLPLYKTLDYNPCLIEQKFINDANLDGYIKYMACGDNRLRLMIIDYFSSIDNEIFDIFNIVGSKSISDILKLKIGENYREIMGIDYDIANLKQYVQINKKKLELDDFQIKMHNSSALLDILIKYFVPVEMAVSNQVFDNIYTTVLINRYKYDKVVNSEESSKFKFEVMLDNCYKITIKCARTKYVFVILGYFNYDVSNTVVTTSQVCNNFIYYKKKCLIDYVKDQTHINKDYKDVYLANMSIGDILSYK